MPKKFRITQLPLPRYVRTAQVTGIRLHGKNGQRVLLTPQPPATEFRVGDEIDVPDDDRIVRHLRRDGRFSEVPPAGPPGPPVTPPGPPG